MVIEDKEDKKEDITKAQSFITEQLKELFTSQAENFELNETDLYLISGGPTGQPWLGLKQEGQQQLENMGRNNQ